MGARGFDFDFQVGGDVPMTSFLTIGPCVDLRVGAFGHYHVKCGARGCVDVRTMTSPTRTKRRMNG